MGEMPVKKSIDLHTKTKSSEVSSCMKTVNKKNDVVCQELTQILGLLSRIPGKNRLDLLNPTLVNKYVKSWKYGTTMMNKIEQKILTALSISLDIKNDLLLYPMFVKATESNSMDQLSKTNFEPQEMSEKKLKKYVKSLSNQKYPGNLKATTTPTRVIIGNSGCSIKAMLTPNKVSLKATIKTGSNLVSSSLVSKTTSKQIRFKSPISTKKIPITHGYSFDSKPSQQGQKCSTLKVQSSSKLRNEKSNKFISRVNVNTENTEKPRWRF